MEINLANLAMAMLLVLVVARGTVCSLDKMDSVWLRSNLTESRGTDRMEARVIPSSISIRVKDQVRELWRTSSDPSCPPSTRRKRMSDSDLVNPWWWRWRQSDYETIFHDKTKKMWLIHPVKFWKYFLQPTIYNRHSVCVYLFMLLNVLIKSS